MPFNKLKIYNQLLDLIGLGERERVISLKGVFNRDFEENTPTFLQKEIHPTPREDGEIPMETLFRHLTTEMTDKVTRAREFEMDRSVRLHWIRFHLNQKKKTNMLLFSVREPEGIRTYYYDSDEKYVIILEPLRNKNAYYLITAYFVKGKDAKRNKIEKKYKRRLDKVY